MKTSPKPWRVATNHDKDFYGELVLDKKGNLVADCNISNISDANCKSNAKLISSAPELLDALIIACNLIGIDPEQKDISGCSHDAQTIICAIRKANNL